MRKILVLLMMLFSLYCSAWTAGVEVKANDAVDVKLEKGNSDNNDTYPRTLIPFTCVYADGVVQLTLLGEVGEFTFIVTNQLTGEQWSVENALTLQASNASGTYWVQIETEDGSIYYGTYTL